jgi:hypothetical protein
MPPVIDAEREGHCDYCDEAIEVGQRIRKHDHYGWIHSDPITADGSCYEAATEAEEE